MVFANRSAALLLSGDTEQVCALEQARSGRRWLYTHAQAFHIRDFIDAYERATGTNAVIRQAFGLDVYEGSLSGWRILEYLMTPCETCRFCTDKPRYIKWSQGCRDVTEWESNK